MITLRPVEREDLKQLQLWRNSPEVRENVNEFRYLNMEDQADWFDWLTRNNSVQMFLIELVDENARDNFKMEGYAKPIGCCGVTKIDWTKRLGEVSIYIGPDDYRGKGFGKIIMNLLEHWAFNDAGLHKLVAYSWEGNIKAHAMFLTCNYREVGVYKSHTWRNGGWADVHIFEKVF